MTLLDQSVHAHMAHGAMACGDPLTECLCDQMAPKPELGAAAEPADAATPSSAHASQVAMQAALDRLFSSLCTKVARREYARGWVYGVVCGLVAGVCTTGGGIWLWGVAIDALRCPSC